VAVGSVVSFSSTADTRTNALSLLIVKLQRELDVAGSLGVSNLAKIRSQCCLANCYFTHDSSVFPSCYDSAMQNPLVVLINLNIDGCRTGWRRNRAIVGPNGPKTQLIMIRQ